MNNKRLTWLPAIIKTLFFSLMLGLGVSAIADEAIPQHLVKAVDKALLGRGGTDLKVFGHDFRISNIAPGPKRGSGYKMRLADGRVVIVQGSIDHKLSLRKDDVVAYRIIVEDGNVISADITDVDRGGLLRSMDLGRAADMNDMLHMSATREARDWEQVMRYIVAVVADRLVLQENLAKHPRPGSQSGSGGSGDRDHRTGSSSGSEGDASPAVRDHRDNGSTTVTDHRDGSSGAAVTDHRSRN